MVNFIKKNKTYIQGKFKTKHQKLKKPYGVPKQGSGGSGRVSGLGYWVLYESWDAKNFV